MGSVHVDKRAQDKPKLISCWGSVGRRKILGGKCWNQAAARTNIPLESYRALKNGVSAF